MAKRRTPGPEGAMTRTSSVNRLLPLAELAKLIEASGSRRVSTTDCGSGSLSENSHQAAKQSSLLRPELEPSSLRRGPDTARSLSDCGPPAVPVHPPESVIAPRVASAIWKPRKPKPITCHAPGLDSRGRDNQRRAWQVPDINRTSEATGPQSKNGRRRRPLRAASAASSVPD